MNQEPSFTAKDIDRIAASLCGTPGDLQKALATGAAALVVLAHLIERGQAQQHKDISLLTSHLDDIATSVDLVPVS